MFVQLGRSNATFSSHASVSLWPYFNICCWNYGTRRSKRSQNVINRYIYSALPNGSNYRSTCKWLSY